MKEIINSIKKVRKAYVGLMTPMSIDDLNEIPTGFNNNIIWNYAHVIVTQQLLTYGLSDNKLFVDMDMVKEFKKGTKPSRYYTAADLESYQKIDAEAIAQFELDYDNNMFKEYTTYKTSIDIELRSIESAMRFNVIHESLHFGSLLALRRMIEHNNG